LEDIDGTRCRPAFAAAVLEDVAWLGLHWDGDVRVQSAHLGDYRAALRRLEGFLYPCFCSRADIARAQGAPHGAEAVYPGTCRGLDKGLVAERVAAGAGYALRLDVARALRAVGRLRYFEESEGWVAAVPEGDVILARRDIATSYHLCVVHDDAVQGVSHVIRGADLREAVPVQVLLQRLLGVETPAYAHHQLLIGPDGRRLAKRDGAAALRELREAGVAAETVLKMLEQSEAR
jgi:glutamyl-Q tRNA(Asp) synthetase